MTQPTIRLATAGDAPRVVAHFDRHIAESGQGSTPVFTPLTPDRPWHDDSLAGQLQGFWVRGVRDLGWGRCWIVEAGPDVVGALVLRGPNVPACMHRATLAMGLEAPHRGRGLGRALMQAAVDWAEAQPELAWLDLRVFAHNEVGLHLYRQFGFVEQGRVEDFLRIGGQTIDDILMARPLGLDR